MDKIDQLHSMVKAIFRRVERIEQHLGIQISPEGKPITFEWEAEFPDEPEYELGESYKTWLNRQ